MKSKHVFLESSWAKPGSLLLRLGCSSIPHPRPVPDLVSSPCFVTMSSDSIFQPLARGRSDFGASARGRRVAPLTGGPWLLLFGSPSATILGRARNCTRKNRKRHVPPRLLQGALLSFRRVCQRAQFSTWGHVGFLGSPDSPLPQALVLADLAGSLAPGQAPP